MKFAVGALGAVLMLGAATQAQAGDAETIFPQGWYVAPMFSYDKVDSKRCTDDGKGATVAVGDHASFLALELSLQYMGLSYDCSYSPPATRETGTARLQSGELTLLAGPFTDIPVLNHVFGLVGVGGIRTENHPKFAADSSNTFGDAGVGYLQPFTLWGWHAIARAETRYRYESLPGPHFNNTPNSFQDLIFNVGVQIALFGSEAAVPPAAEPVAVVPAAEPAPAPAPAPAPEVAPTPEAAVAASDAEPTLETAKVGDKIVLHGVNFETAKATLTSNAKTILDGVAKDLNARPELKVEIGGHTDGRGKAGYNQKLSEKRAKSVQDYLAQQGVAAERLSAVGYGKTQPVDTNETDEGRERNRRVELKIVQ